MKIIITLMSSFVLMGFVFAQTDTAKETLESFLTPEYLAKIDWSKAVQKEAIIRVVGKPSLVEKNKSYFEVQGLKYPLSLTTDKSGRVEKIYFRPLGKKIYSHQLKKFLKSKPKIENKDRTYYSLHFEKEKTVFRFYVSDNRLFSVERSY